MKKNGEVGGSSAVRLRGRKGRALFNLGVNFGSKMGEEDEFVCVVDSGDQGEMGRSMVSLCVFPRFVSCFFYFRVSLPPPHVFVLATIYRR